MTPKELDALKQYDKLKWNDCGTVRSLIFISKDRDKYLFICEDFEDHGDPGDILFVCVPRFKNFHI